MQTSHRCRITSEDFGQEKRYINIPPSPISLQKILKMNYISSFWDIHNSCRKSFCQSESFPNYPKHIECFFFGKNQTIAKYYLPADEKDHLAEDCSVDDVLCFEKTIYLGYGDSQRQSI